MSENQQISEAVSMPQNLVDVPGTGSIVTAVTVVTREVEEIKDPATVVTGVTVVTKETEEIEDPAAVPFPTIYLPDVVAEMVEAVSQSEGTPRSLGACCALGVVSASIGRGLRVRSGPDRTTPGNIYIIGSAQSGTAKSITYKHFARPLLEFEAGLVEDWKMNILPGAQAEKAVLEEELKNLRAEVKKVETPEARNILRAQIQEKMEALEVEEAKMVRPALTVEDVTTEKLGLMLHQNGECMAHFSADAGAVLNNLFGRYNPLKRVDDSLLVKAFSGDPVYVDRIGRGHIDLKEPLLTVLWLLQPEKLESVLGNASLVEGGLMPRMLSCHTNCQPEHITGSRVRIPIEVIQRYSHLVRSLLQTYRIPNESRIIKAHANATEWLNMIHNRIVDRRKSELRDTTIFAARWAEHAWRLAVVLHAMKYGEEACKTELELDTAVHAGEIGKWFANQQLAILEAGRIRVRRDKRDAVMELLMDDQNGVTARDVQRARITVDSQQAKELLADMEAKGFLQGDDVTPAGGGKMTRLYTRKIR